MFGITRFSQLLTHLPKRAFQKIVAECGADKYLKKLKSWDLMTIMLYGQLTQAKSLLTLRHNTALQSKPGVLDKASARSPSHSTASADNAVQERIGLDYS